VRALLVPLVTVLIALPACGGDDGGGSAGGGGTAPEAWAKQVCGSVGSWLEDVQKRSSAIGDTAQGANSLKEAKSQFVTYFEELVARTDKMITEIEDAGDPDVEDGDAIGEDFRNTIAPMRDALADARDQAEDLPTDDPQAFAQGAVKAGESVEREGTQVGQAFDRLDEKYDTAELQRAFKDEPACTEL